MYVEVARKGIIQTAWECMTTSQRVEDETQQLLKWLATKNANRDRISHLMWPLMAFTIGTPKYSPDKDSGRGRVC